MLFVVTSTDLHQQLDGAMPRMIRAPLGMPP